MRRSVGSVCFDSPGIILALNLGSSTEGNSLGQRRVLWCVSGFRLDELGAVLCLRV